MSDEWVHEAELAKERQQIEEESGPFIRNVVAREVEMAAQIAALTADLAAAREQARVRGEALRTIEQAAMVAGVLLFTDYDEIDVDLDYIRDTALAALTPAAPAPEPDALRDAVTLLLRTIAWEVDEDAEHPKAFCRGCGAYRDEPHTEACPVGRVAAMLALASTQPAPVVDARREAEQRVIEAARELRRWEPIVMHEEGGSEEAARLISCYDAAENELDVALAALDALAGAGEEE